MKNFIITTSFTFIFAALVFVGVVWLLVPELQVDIESIEYLLTNRMKEGQK